MVKTKNEVETQYRLTCNVCRHHSCAMFQVTNLYQSSFCLSVCLSVQNRIKKYLPRPVLSLSPNSTVPHSYHTSLCECKSWFLNNGWSYKHHCTVSQFRIPNSSVCSIFLNLIGPRINIKTRRSKYRWPKKYFSRSNLHKIGYIKIMIQMRFLRENLAH